jgi:hypothetical protein
MFDRRTNIELTTEPPLAYTRCYKLVRFNSTELDLKDETFFFSFLCGGK